MARPIAELERDIRELAAAERIRLIKGLISDIDAPADVGVDQAWMGEVERRLEEFDAGSAKTYAAEHVMNEAGRRRR